MAFCYEILQFGAQKFLKNAHIYSERGVGGGSGVVYIYIVSFLTIIFTKLNIYKT